MRNVRRKQVAESRKRRRIVYITFGILFFMYFTVNLIIGDNGLLKYVKLKSVKNRLLAETTVVDHQNDDARSQVEALKDEPERVEEIAREFGLTKKGELIFKFDDEQQ